MKPQVSLILPAYNEVRTIAGTVKEAVAYFEERQLTYEIFVAADGEDGTREVVAQMAGGNPRLRVLGSHQRSGKGRGIRQATALAEGKIIGFSDADNKTPITELDAFLPLLREGGYDLAIGSRAAGQARIERPQPLYRRAGSRLFNALTAAALGLRGIPDTQCGFKFFRGAVARDLFARQRIDGYMFDVEILRLARRSGYRIAQVPVRWRDDADSRLDLVRGNLRNIRDILAIRLT